MKRASTILAALVFLAPAVASAHGSDGHPADPNLHVNSSLKDCSVQFAPELTQDAFARFVREFGSVSAFKMMSPPPTLGRGRVALGLEGISFTVEEKADAWNDTFAHPDAYHELGAKKQFPKVRLAVGVTDRLDLGAFYTENPQANYGWLGLECKYAMLRQGPAMPVALALRGAYTKTLYVDDMDMHALTADVAAGRTFWGCFTPYLGVGGDLVFARETSDVVDLHDETQPVSHAFGGLELRLWHVAIGAEASQAALSSLQVHLTALF
jgi:hypothetical protein